MVRGWAFLETLDRLIGSLNVFSIFSLDEHMCAGGKIGKDSCSVSFNNVFSWRTTLHIDRSLLYLLWNNIYSVFFHRETVVDLWLQDLQIWKATWLLELFLEARLGKIGRFDCFQAVWLVSLDHFKHSKSVTPFRA